MKTYRIITTIQEGIRDNQGVAVHNALHKSFGFTNVNSVKIGKTYTLTIDEHIDINAIAKKLTNEVMEDYRIEELSTETDSELCIEKPLQTMMWMTWLSRLLKKMRLIRQ